MSINNPPIFNTSIFNNNAFYDSNSNLTLEDADLRYLKLTGGILYGSLLINNELNINRSTNGEVIKFNNGIVYGSIHLTSNNFHIGSTNNHNFNLQCNSNNVAQCKTSGNFNIVNNLELGGNLILDSNLDISNIRDLTLNGSIKLGLSNIYNNSNNLTLSTTATNGGFTLESSYFNYSDTLLQLINSNATYGMMSLKIDLVKASPINYRIYSPNSSMIFNTNTVSSSSNNALFFSAGGGNVGFNTTIPNRNLEINTDCAINRLFIGDTAKTSGDRLINILTTGAPAIRFGKALSNNNCFTINFNQISAGSTSNNLSFDIFGGSNQLTISATGGVSIGTSSVSGGLSIGTSQNLTYGPGGLTWHRYRIVSDLYDTGTGPTSYSTGINCGNTYIQALGILQTSDIRLKKDVKNIEVDNIIHLYKNIKAKSFIWKHNNQIDMGFIAQDLVKEKHIELIGITEPNNDVIKNILKNDQHPKDNLLYPENIQLNVQYNKFPVYNFTMIQYLLNELEKIKDFISTLDIEDVSI